MRTRLILSFVIVVLISIIIVVLIARQSAANEVRAFMFRGGMTDSGGLVESLENYYAANGSWKGVESLFRNRGHGMGSGQMGQSGMASQHLRLADRDGYLVYDSVNLAEGENIARSELDDGIQLQNNGNLVGYLLIEGGMEINRTEERNLINRLNTAAITAALVAGSISLLIAFFLAYRLLRPIRDLTHAAEKLGQGDLSERVPVHGNDELAMLGMTFNQMAASLEHAEKSRRAMTADIAHELRNPLAVQRANLEALQDGIYPLTPQNLEPVIEQNTLLNRLVEDLQTLALADSGQLELDVAEVNLKQLVKRVVERYTPNAAANNIAIRFLSSDGVDEESFYITIDPIRIEQVIGNLLSNAIRYTPPGGTIELHLKTLQGGISLEIHDSGPGIPAAALPYVFDRFYRADRSRSRADGGTGLGLAIARQLTRAHGGELSASNHPDGGAVFTLRLTRSTSDKE